MSLELSLSREQGFAKGLVFRFITTYGLHDSYYRSTTLCGLIINILCGLIVVCLATGLLSIGFSLLIGPFIWLTWMIFNGWIAPDELAIFGMLVYAAIAIAALVVWLMSIIIRAVEDAEPSKPFRNPFRKICIRVNFK